MLFYPLPDIIASASGYFAARGDIWEFRGAQGRDDNKTGFQFRYALRGNLDAAAVKEVFELARANRNDVYENVLRLEMPAEATARAPFGGEVSHEGAQAAIFIECATATF